MEMGPELESILTDNLGFLAIAGDAKVQLTPQWSPPPASTASLLSVASRRGLAAAAGPDTIILSSTESIRKAFSGDKNGDTEIRSFDPEVKVPMSTRISHLAFTPDEQHLILCAEQGGGLAVYETQSLLQGNFQPAFEINTNGESIKALVPNPMPELAEFSAVVTNAGNLMIANLKEKSLVSGPNGPIIRAQVTSVAWSTKGKQLVAGMADGTIVQMTPDGTEKASIPKPDLPTDVHVSTIAWVENHLFLAIYNENAGSPPASEYFIITRRAPPGQSPSYEFRKLTDPIMPFGNEVAPQHVVLRMRDYPPGIQEMLVLASSAQDQIGLLTKTKEPLTKDVPAERITDVFTTTEFTDDSRRAQLPTDENYNESVPIGMSLDLSSKDNIYKPIPSDEEIEMSPGPLPAVWALNNNGVLSAWWIVYTDAIRQGKTYSGMASLQSEPAAQPAAPAATSSAFGGSSAFGSAAPALAASNGTPSPFGGGTTASSGPKFGAPAFGSPSMGSQGAAPAFGQSAGTGSRSSPWAAGSTSAATPAFGSHGFSNTLPPAAGGFNSGNKVFGSGAASGDSSTGGGFASFASKGGFSALAGNNNSGGGSIFSQPSSSSPFGANNNQKSAFGGASGGSGQSPFGKPSGTGAFGSPEVSMGGSTAFPPASSTAKSGSTFGSSPFVLGTTFKADPASANDNEKPSEKGGFSLGGMGLSLGDSTPKPAESTAESKDEVMDTATPTEQEQPKSLFGQPQESTTPTATPAPSKFFSTDNTNAKPNPFSSPANDHKPFGSTILQPSSTKPNPFAPSQADTPAANSSVFASKPSDRPNPFAPKDTAVDAADPPLPPDSTSKASYPFGDSSASSVVSAKSIEDLKKISKPVDDAPLPPDFMSSKPKTKDPTPPPLPREESSAAEEAPLPPDFTTKPKPAPTSSLFQPKEPPAVPESPSELSEGDEESDDEDAEGEGDDEEAEGESEGSGIDVAKDLSPTSAGATTQSSFGKTGSGSFSFIGRSNAAEQPASSGSLFGQQPRASIFGNSAQNLPVFPKPNPTSPHSPSPVRSAVPQRVSGEGSRSFSAPGMASQIPSSSRPQGSLHSKSISSRVQPQEDPNVALQREAQKKQAEQEQYSLEDEEYEKVQAMLESPVEPSLDIGEFTAFHSITADAHASTVAAQVEALYRDMNGMLVTLGLNARALAGFIKGHEELRTTDRKTKDDLEDFDDWVLCEADDLNHILDDELTPELEEGRAQDLDDTWDTCQGLVREMPKLRAKQQDLKRILAAVLDPDQAALTRTLPLSAEQAAQQNELRQTYARLSKLMADAESALTMVKTRLASLAGAAGKSAAVPTVEAIMRTITRMTSAAEKRSGDLDVLESQMRKLRVGSVGPTTSRESSPAAFMTPPSNKRQSQIMSGSAHSPSPRRSLNGSGRAGPSPRKKVSGFTADDKNAIRQKMQKKQEVLDRLRDKLVEYGPKVSRMGDPR